jgi:hypothetical protein
MFATYTYADPRPLFSHIQDNPDLQIQNKNNEKYYRRTKLHRCKMEESLFYMFFNDLNGFYFKNFFSSNLIIKLNFCILLKTAIGTSPFCDTLIKN